MGLLSTDELIKLSTKAILCTVTINKTASIWDNNGGATQSIPVRIERKERNKNRSRRVFEE